MGNLVEATGEDRIKEAWEIALRNGAIGPLHRVEDKWGGYWQCETVYGPYTFRASGQEPSDRPLAKGGNVG